MGKRSLRQILVVSCFVLANLVVEARTQCLRSANGSVATQCAEHDNVKIEFYGRTSSFQIEATHPSEYSVGTDSCAADFTNCPSLAEPGFPFPAGMFELMNDGETIVQAWRVGSWWRPNGMDASADSGPPVTDVHYITVARKIAGANEWPQFFVLYMDGYLRLIPHPPVGSRSVCFGSSVIVGPVRGADRPLAEIASVRYLSATKTLEVIYRAGGSAILDLSNVDRSSARVQVTVRYATNRLPFATFRSMFIEPGNADVDRVLWRETSDAQRDEPIMSFRGGVGTAALFYRRTRSRKNTSAPDIRITILAGECRVRRVTRLHSRR